MQAAIITAGRSFNHRIVQHRETPHKLVTKG